mgnify:CR=1 FL=1
MLTQLQYQNKVFRDPEVKKLAYKVYENMTSNEIREYILRHESLQALRKMNHRQKRTAVILNLLDEYKRQSPDILRNLYAKTFNLKPLKLRSGNGKTIIKFIDSELKITKK